MQKLINSSLQWRDLEFSGWFFDFESIKISPKSKSKIQRLELDEWLIEKTKALSLQMIKILIDAISKSNMNESLQVIDMWISYTKEVTSDSGILYTEDYLDIVKSSGLNPNISVY